MLRRRLLGRLLPCGLVLLFLLAAGIFLAVKLPAALAPIAAGERLLSFCAALFVLARSPAEQKTFRLFLLLIPWLGAALCFFLRGEKPFSPVPCAPFENEEMNAVASLAAANGLCGGYADGAEYFSTGGEMYPRLLADLRAAKREIFLDYYILARGRFFDDVLHILEEKAERGLKIKLVYDDFGCAKLPRKFASVLRARGISATVFGPLRPFAFARFNLRDHRKLALIDRRIAYTGGVNLADEYIGEKIRFGHWKDTAVRLFGDVCAQFAPLFGEQPPQEGTSEGGPIPCVPFADGAGGKRTGEAVLLRLISSARHTLEICTPYLVPSERLLYALQCAARAGVKVRLMLPHIPDKKSVFLLSRHYARELLSAGVEVREYTAGFLHAKSVTADGKYAYIGSYNLDRRSLFTQAECGAVLESAPFTAEAVRDFDGMWKAGTPVRKEKPLEKVLRILLLPLAPWI